MPTPNINTAFYKATNGTASRVEGDRWADVINVKDYGALGDGSTNDAAAIQAAFDAAFGTSGSPHGTSGVLTNKAVFFPAGNYVVNTPLTLTKIVSGHIFGSSNRGTKISYGGSVAGGGTITAIITTNGCANLWLEKMQFGISGTNTCALNLNWDGSSTNCDGLHNNLVSDVLISDCTNGIIIANSGNGGANNLFESVTIHSTTSAGIDARGANATGQTTLIGGGAGNAVLYKASGGSFTLIGMAPSGSTTADLQVTANWPNAILGGRTEGPVTVAMTTGLVSMRGLHWNAPGAGVFANITGGKCIVDACTSNLGVITGTAGSLYVRGCSFPGSFHSGYSGTVVEEI